MPECVTEYPGMKANPMPAITMPCAGGTNYDSGGGQGGIGAIGGAGGDSYAGFNFPFFVPNGRGGGGGGGSFNAQRGTAGIGGDANGGAGYAFITFDYTAPPPPPPPPPPVGGVPEPGTWALLIAGFGAIGTASRRQRAAESGTPRTPSFLQPWRWLSLNP